MSITTDMDLANPTSPLETDWEESTLNVALEKMIHLEQRSEHLKALINKVYGTRDKTSLTALQRDADVSSISLEGHCGTITQKNVITAQLRIKHESVEKELNIGLEDYVTDIKEDISDKLKAYDKILTKLKTTDADIESPDNKNVQINHTRVYEMFHVKEQFQGAKPLDAVRKEDTNLQRLVTMLGTGVARIKRDIDDLGVNGKLERKAQDLPKVDRLFLMFNRRAAIVDGQLEYKDIKTAAPKKFMNWKQNVIIALGAIFLGQFGGQMARALQTAKGNSAKVENKLGDVHRFIRYVEGMEDIIDDLSKHVDELVKLFSKVDESNKSALNRRAAPVMELAEFVVKHVTDITRGTDTLFSRLVRKN